MLPIVLEVSTAQAPEEKRHQVVSEILAVAAQNGSLVQFNTQTVRGVAGVNRVVVPADGDSVAWGTIRLTDNKAQPVVHEPVIIETNEGQLYIDGEIPFTDSNGNLVFIIRPVEVRDAGVKIRLFFPRLQIHCQIELLFCIDCFTTLQGCPSFERSVKFSPDLDNPEIFICSDSEFAHQLNLEMDFSYYHYFYSSTFRAPNRPSVVFPEVNGNTERCYYREYFPCYGDCINYPDRWVYLSVADTYRLPNDDIEAEIEYFIYTPDGGRTCRENFTLVARNPILVIENPEDLYVKNTETRLSIGVVSPLVRGSVRDPVFLYRNPFILSVWTSSGNWIQSIPIMVPTDPIEIVIPRLHNIPSGTSINVELAGATLVDKIRGYLHLQVHSIFPLGRNTSTRTFDFEITYELSHSRQLSTTRGASQGTFIVRDPRDEEIFRYSVPPEKLSLGQHTVVIKIPEDRMTRFGTYHFVPYFVDDLAGYYRDSQPRLANYFGNIRFTTPPYLTEQAYFQAIIPVYCVYNVPNQNRDRLVFPFEGDSCYITLLIGNYLYDPIPRELHSALMVRPDRWRTNGGAECPNDREQIHQRATYSFESFENNRQAQQMGSSYRLWPGPKLEFRWLKLTHNAFRENPRAERLYYWRYRDTSVVKSYYRWQSSAGTHYFAVAVSAPELDYYIVTGPYIRNGERKISKREFDRLLRNGNLTSRRADDNQSAPLRISVRRPYQILTQPHKLAVIKWATAFLNVRYEWGGSWFGGRAHPTQRNGSFRGYQGFGIDCSKLISASAELAGLRWDRAYRYNNRDLRWWDIGTIHLADNRFPFTQGWNTSKQARLNAQPGDILVRSGSHVALIVDFSRVIPIRNPRTRQVDDHMIWATIIDSSGHYNGVTINDGEHLTLRNTRENPRVRMDTVGDLMERGRYSLRQLIQIQPR